MLAMFCGLLMAEISPFTLVGEGSFAGKLGSYASGDTIVFVTKPPIPNTIRYKYSHDGGLTWQVSDVLFPSYGEDFSPTLSYTPNETIVSFKSALQNMIAVSPNGETFNDIIPMYSNTFDNSPYVEKYNGQIKRFSLDLPYPEKIKVGGEMQMFPGIHPDDPDEFIAPFHYTDTELNSDNEPEYFTGKDVLNGIVRTNNDLYIKQTGEGENNGWPIFNSPVVIGGMAVSIPPQYPRDLIFRGGLVENAPTIDISTGSLREIAALVGPPSYDPDNIIMVEVDGGSFSGMWGKVQAPRRVFTDVWPNYPEGTTEPPSFRNNFTVQDTVWTPLPSNTCMGRVNFVNGKLWIKGRFAGNQTWVAAGDIEIIGDVLIYGTEPPNGPNNNGVSTVDLISERSIRLKYGYYNPIDTIREHTNMGADTDYAAPAGGGTWIYASLYALGNGGGTPNQDGVFTFEYQHPHGSIPATIINVPTPSGPIPTWFDWIDLHRNRWPQTTSQPWPANLDYPWYNPLWPENAPYLERGTANIWGSIFQRRRGFIHRDYYDNNHHSNGVWNPGMDLYGGSSSPDEGYVDPVLGINMQTRNYPGAMGNGIGYKKNYNPDPRTKMSIESYPYYMDPLCIWKLGLNLSNHTDVLGMESYYQKPYILVPKDKCFARKGERAYYSLNDQLLYADLDEVTDISPSTKGDGIIRSIALSPDSSPLVYQLAEVDSTFSMTVKDINAVSGTVAFETSFPVASMINDVCVLPNGRRLVARFENPGTISLWEITPQNVMNPVENWQMDAGLLPSADRLKTSRLYMMPSDNDGVEVFFYVPADTAIPNSNGSLYHAHASFPVSNEDYSVPSVPAIRFTAYPNPMRDELKIEVENARASIVTLVVFNVKGQKVRSIPLPNSNNSAKIEYTWKGTDANNHRVANGIYLLRLMANNKVITTKRICTLSHSTK
jgi:hypothetical protein